MKTINARGKNCPEPVIITKGVVDQGETELEVLLDNPTSASNVTRFLESRGYGVVLKDDEGLLTVSARLKNKKEENSAKTTPQKTSAPPTDTAQAHRAKVPQTLAVLITASTLGRSDEQLGEILIKGFLGTLSQMDTPPVTIALMNEGVRLATYDSSTCDHLKNLEKRGTTILVCGTCVNHFALGDAIGVGTVSNMFEIVDALNSAGKILTI